MSKTKKVEYVEVLENKLLSEEDLDTLVRIPFFELLEINLQKLLQTLTVLAIGADDSGQFKIDQLVVQLAGVVDEDIVFRIKGKLQKYEVQKKSLPRLEQKKKVRRIKRKK